MHSRRKVIPFRTDEDETEPAIFLLMERKNDRSNGPARRKISILQYAPSYWLGESLPAVDEFYVTPVLCRHLVQGMTNSFIRLLL